MGGEGLGGRYGRPLGKHHATEPGARERALGDGADPGTTRDEGLDKVDPRPADHPAFHDLLADDALNMDRRVGDAYAHVKASKFGSRSPARWKTEWTAAFLRGFFMSFGIVLGACAGVVISGVLVLLLLTVFGAGQ